MVTKNNVQFHANDAILIDFGKACSFANAKRTELSEGLKAEYREKHAHIAPEIIEGKSKQSPARDVYACFRESCFKLKVGEFCKCEQIIVPSKLCLNDKFKRCTLKHSS